MNWWASIKFLVFFFKFYISYKYYKIVSSNFCILICLKFLNCQFRINFTNCNVVGFLKFVDFINYWFHEKWIFWQSAHNPIVFWSNRNITVCFEANQKYIFLLPKIFFVKFCCVCVFMCTPMDGRFLPGVRTACAFGDLPGVLYLQYTKIHLQQNIHK